MTPVTAVAILRAGVDSVPEDHIEAGLFAAGVIEQMLGLGEKVPTRDELLRSVEAVARMAHRYYADCEVGVERLWGANLYDILRTAPREARE